MSQAQTPGEIDPQLLALIRRYEPDACVVGATALRIDDGAQEQQVTAKSAGYGVPIRIDVRVRGESQSFVLHGASANRFGHDRRADRAAELLLAADSFASIPRHTRALDVGAFLSDGSSISLLGSQEFYLLTDYAPGVPYAEDLRRIARTAALEAKDNERVRILAHYLARLHAERPRNSIAYQRSLRDLLGGGQGIFGIVDAYGGDTLGADCQRLQRIEELCLGWRWKFKQREERLSRIHADFHPFNVLFDDRSELRVLDTSRGSLGDAADDVACMSINYLFFALENPASWLAAFSPLWRRFWEQYLTESRDMELLEVVAPFLAWRVLVLACPSWYPNLALDVRDRLLTFAEATLRSERFDPELAEAVFW